MSQLSKAPQADHRLLSSAKYRPGAPWVGHRVLWFVTHYHDELEPQRTLSRINSSTAESVFTVQYDIDSTRDDL